MRKLIFTRGLQGCGKSTFIEEHCLSPYTVSSDKVRLLVASTNMNLDGNLVISTREEKYVWDMLRQILEFRLERGMFTVFDATNTKTSDMNYLKQLAEKYDYEIFCLDFSHIPIDVCKERNKRRGTMSIVPDKSIDKMHARLQQCKIPSGIKVIKPENFEDIFYDITDYSKYNAINFIGDIHGCYDKLVKLLETIKDDELYVFCGDYIDRGPKNVETLHFLFDLMDKENVIFLRGNHERHLIKWLNGGEVTSLFFATETSVEFEKKGLDKNKAKKFVKKLNEFFYGSFNGKKIFACHGGIPKIPNRIDFLLPVQLIGGVGNYNECEEIERTFNENTDGTYLVHGHRNIQRENIHPFEFVFNLENAVEFDGSLRMVTFKKDNIETKEIY